MAKNLFTVLFTLGMSIASALALQHATAASNSPFDSANYESLVIEYATLSAPAMTSDFSNIEESSSQTCMAYDSGGSTDPLLLRILREIDSQGHVVSGGRRTLLTGNTPEDYEDIAKNRFVRLRLQERLLKQSSLREEPDALWWRAASSSMFMNVAFRKGSRAARILGQVESSSGPQMYLCVSN